MKIVCLVLSLFLATFCSASVHATSAPKAQVKAGKLGKAAKVVTFPLRHPVRTSQAVLGASVGASFDTLEAAVDVFGLAVEVLGAGVQGVGQGLESLPKPLYYVGDGLDYAGGYLNKGGAFLAR